MKVNPSVSADWMLVIPTYNNAKTLAVLLEELKSHASRILVIDDGSTDQIHMVKASYPEVGWVHHSTNLGKGAALLTGLRIASERGYRSMISMDADGQHLAGDLSAMVAAALAAPDSLIIGDRDFVAAESGNIPSSSRFGRKFSNFWVRVETGIKLQDTQSGFRVYPVQAINQLRFSRWNYDFEIEVLVRAAWAGIQIKSIPIGVHYPPPSERVSHFRPYLDNFRLSTLHTRLVTIRLLSMILGRTAPKAHSSHREKPGAAVLEFFVKFAGISVCYALAPIVVSAYFIFDRNGRKAITDFYLHLHGRNPTAYVIFQNYLYFAMSLIDRLAMATGRLNALASMKHVTSIRSIPAGSILVGAHFGDWALCGQALTEETNGKIAVVIDLKLSPRFQKLASKDAAFQVIDASGSGVNVILGVKEVLQAGGLVCLLGDRTSPNQRLLRIPFFGEEAEFPATPYELAKLFRVGVYSFTCLKSRYRPGAPHLIHIQQLWDGIQDRTSEQLANEFVQNLEALARKSPQHWFNFSPFWQGSDATRNAFDQRQQLATH